MSRSVSVLQIFLFLLLFFPGCSPRGGKTITQVCFSGRCFNVEIAGEHKERMRGLQFRQSLGENEGMLFVFPKGGRQSFWMKDTFISLDIIWMDQDKRVAHIIPNVLPCTTAPCPVYTPDRDAIYVLEVNAGVTMELGLKAGDQAVFQ